MCALYRLYESDLDADNVKKSLRTRILALRQDETIRQKIILTESFLSKNLVESYLYAPTNYK